MRPWSGVGGVVVGLRHVRGRIGEKVDDILVQDRSVGLQREQIVAAAGDDPFRDVGLGPHGVDGDERAGQLQSFEQQPNSDDFIGLLIDRLLRQNQTLTGGPGADHVQRLAALGARVGSSRGLAVDGDDGGRALAQAGDPGGARYDEKGTIRNANNAAQIPLSGAPVENLIRFRVAHLSAKGYSVPRSCRLDCGQRNVVAWLRLKKGKL